MSRDKWCPDPREAYQSGQSSRNEWREITSQSDTICGSQKGIRTPRGCGEIIPAGEQHALKASAWRGQVKSRVWATHFHQGCVAAEIAAENRDVARLTGRIVLICKVCGHFLGLHDGEPRVWLGHCVEEMVGGAVIAHDEWLIEAYASACDFDPSGIIAVLVDFEGFCYGHLTRGDQLEDEVL